MAVEAIQGRIIETPPTAGYAAVSIDVGDQLVLRPYPGNNAFRPFSPINIAVRLPNEQGVQTAIVEFNRKLDGQGALTNTVQMQIRLRSYPEGRGLVARANDGYIHARYGPIVRIEKEDGEVQELDAPGTESARSRRGVDFTAWADTNQIEQPLEFPLGSEEDPDSLLYALNNGKVTMAFVEYDIDQVYSDQL